MERLKCKSYTSRGDRCTLTREFGMYCAKHHTGRKYDAPLSLKSCLFCSNPVFTRSWSVCHLHKGTSKWHMTYEPSVQSVDTGLVTHQLKFINKQTGLFDLEPLGPFTFACIAAFRNRKRKYRYDTGPDRLQQLIGIFNSVFPDQQQTMPVLQTTSIQTPATGIQRPVTNEP